MKAALSIVLAGLLVTTPLKLVLAQADEQHQSQTTTTAQETVVLVGVPALERGSSAALLWSGQATAPASDSLAYDLMYRGPTTAGWIGIGALVVVGVLVVLAIIALSNFCTDEISCS